MSEPLPARAPTADPQATVLAIYQAVAALMLIALAVLVVYAIRLGPLLGPGVESSFGFAAALMFLCAAVLVHLVDRTYRVWPTGRRVHPEAPEAVTDRSIAAFLRIVVLLAVAGAIAYVVATLLI